MTTMLRWSAAALVCVAPALGLATLSVTQADPRIRGLALASDGTDYLVVGTPCADGGAQLCGTRVTGAGGVIEPAGFTISGAAAVEAAVAFDGASYLVAWTGAAGAWFTRLLPDGTVLDPAGVQLWPFGQSPAVASNGSGFLVVWGTVMEPVWDESLMRFMPITAVYQAHVGPDGVAQATETVRWGAVGHHSTSYLYPLVASDGTGYRIAMQVGGYGTCDLTGVERRVQYLACTGPMADLASDGAGYFMVWGNWSFGEVTSTGVLGARLDSPAEPTVVDTGSQVFQRPALSFDGLGYLVVWQDTGFFASRLLTDGTVLDPGGVLLSESGLLLSPRVASSATTSLAIWSVGAALITPLHPEPAGLAPATSPPGGGAMVRLTGAGFEAGATLTIDGQLVADATVEGPGAMTFMAPAHVAGAVDVVVTNPDGRSGRLEGALTYAGVLYLAAVIPARGPETGGTRVTLLGEGFRPGMRVRFDHRWASDVRVIDDGHATCRTPSGSGTVPVMVTGARGVSSTLRRAYRFDHRRPAHHDRDDRHDPGSNGEDMEHRRSTDGSHPGAPAGH